MIREAILEDIPQIVQMIQGFSKDVDISCAQVALSPRRAAQLISLGIDSGLCFVSVERDDTILSGVVLGARGLNVWSETVEELNLLILYVRQEHREGNTGGKLLLKYKNTCNKIMAKDKNVRVSWIQLQGETNITGNSMIKLGYKPLDRIFIKE